MNHFISVEDVADPSGDYSKNLKSLIALSEKYKKNPFADEHFGKKKTLGLIFFNPSLRTRLSSIKAAQNLGLNVISMNTSQDSWVLETADGAVMDQGSAEHIKEAAAVMGTYCDILGVRSFPELKNREEDYQNHMINGFVQHAGVPVINLESATLHPLQSLTDLMTMESLRPNKKLNITMTWAPHIKPLPQSVANSFAEWMGKTAHEVTIVQPPGFELSEEFTAGVKIMHDQDEALKNADVVYVKNWSSYHDYGKVGNFPDWQVTTEKMALTNQALLMHCL
ncbi:MAG: acetylornithine carbamoyltransferase, partial [Bacteroidota bacterium]